LRSDVVEVLKFSFLNHHHRNTAYTLPMIVIRNHLPIYPFQGLVPRAKLLLTLGGTFFLAFGPLILITVAFFSALYFVSSFCYQLMWCVLFY